MSPAIATSLSFSLIGLRNAIYHQAYRPPECDAVQSGRRTVISKSLLILIRRQLRPLHLCLAPLSKGLHQTTGTVPRLNPETSVRDTGRVFTRRKNKLVTDNRDQSVRRNVKQFQQSTCPVGKQKAQECDDVWSRECLSFTAVTFLTITRVITHSSWTGGRACCVGACDCFNYKERFATQFASLLRAPYTLR